MYCDSSSAICLARDPVQHDQTKHIIVKYHFLRTDNRAKVEKIRTADNLANFFTKSVPFNKFKHCLDLLNIDYYVM